MNFNLTESINILERTPAVLIAMLSGLPHDWIHNNEGENTWSPYDIVGHFIHGEKTDWIPRARIILGDQKTKLFESFDRFAQFRDSGDKSLVDLLIEFKTLREKNISALKSMNIQDEHFNYVGIHPELGRVTLKQLLSTWVVHDLSHINQISRVMAKQYRDQAGPWVEYIPLLNK